MYRARTPHLAFTLVELLVVIAIIAILAAILFPVFARAKNAAKGAVCVSNMHQIGLACMMYVDENEGQWFPAMKYDPLPGFAPQKPWIGYDNNNTGVLGGPYAGDVSQPAIHPVREGAIDIYLKSESVKKCPNKSPDVQTALALNGFDTSIPSAYYSTNPKAQGNEYGPAEYKVAQVNGYQDYIGVADSAINEPSQTLLIWEHLSFAPICNFLQSSDWLNSPPNNQLLKDHFNFLHNDGTNTVWCDGHVRRLTYFALKRPWFSVRKDIYN
jgi:prepilin-type N-terminal cleavage/methylation domain-containing protein/prepilin-type processing-associated H-X9-DG protein